MKFLCIICAEKVMEHMDPADFGGYYLLEAKNLEEAIQVASRIPGASRGCVEVRPVAEDERTKRVAARLHKPLTCQKEPGMTKKIFVNLPVKDRAASYRSRRPPMSISAFHHSRLTIHEISAERP